ncbi:hypothetical protein [Sphingobacterium paludis]|uniref:Uncharacterized protein n=1 Tax=Sphingobacterium paludis TaxID=1476465 RepID=A0A4R7CXJ8_9SPHI|nr:hypothetical protein [Sphingobacterium paludis]TDS13010.1 hypothetical protein B0I21_105142 [Sphingobacterium paludis]
MKKFIYVAAIVSLFVFVKPANAQVNVNINIGSQPSWGPAGYDYVRYYYLPEIGVYYDVSSRRYIYPQGNRWVNVRSLPKRYRHVNMNRTYKVVLNHAQPWRNHRDVHNRYHRYANNHSQRYLGDRRTHDRYDKKHHRKGKKHDHDRGRGRRR